MVLKKTFESPLDCREIGLINPKEINSQYSLEGLIVKLKLQYLGHLMPRAHSLEGTLMLGETESKNGEGGDGMRWLDIITNSADMSLSGFPDGGGPGSLAYWGESDMI